MDFPRPNSVKSLERFLGMLNFYHWFIPHAARTLQPLHQALTGKPRPKTLCWSDDMDKGFVSAKEALANATMLHHPVQGALTALTTVWLNDTQITDTGCATLAAAIRSGALPALHDLYLWRGTLASAASRTAVFEAL